MRPDPAPPFQPTLPDLNLQPQAHRLAGIQVPGARAQGASVQREVSPHLPPVQANCALSATTAVSLRARALTPSVLAPSASPFACDGSVSLGGPRTLARDELRSNAVHARTLLLLPGRSERLRENDPRSSSSSQAAAYEELLGTPASVMTARVPGIGLTRAHWALIGLRDPARQAGSGR